MPQLEEDKGLFCLVKPSNVSLTFSPYDITHVFFQGSPIAHIKGTVATQMAEEGKGEVFPGSPGGEGRAQGKWIAAMDHVLLHMSVVKGSFVSLGWFYFIQGFSTFLNLSTLRIPKKLKWSS